MKKNKINLFLFLLLIGIICLHTACKKDKYPTYYKTIGIGYAYDATNNRPLEGVSIEIQSHYEFMFPLYYCDTLVTDKNGAFRVRFMDQGEDSPMLDPPKILSYTFTITDDSLPYWEILYPNTYRDYLSCTPSDFQGQGIFLLDTIKFYKTN